MSIVEFDGLASWSLDASESGKGTKYSWVEAVEGRKKQGDFIGLVM